jgi:signal transduction histidine kinase
VAEAGRAVLDAAWGRLPHTRESTDGFGSFTRTRIERAIRLMVGIACLVLGVQAFVAALGPGDERDGWHLPMVIIVLVPLVAMILACLLDRFARVFSGVFAVVYLLALATWPLASAGSSPVPTEEPWIFFLINVATAAAAVAFSLPLQLAWTIATPLLFGVVRIIQGGGDDAFLGPVALDVTFTWILGGVILTLAWMFRSVAGNVDQTRSRAVASYADAAAAAATERERIAVAALMHDSVLGALLAAERAETPRERTLAVSMAREALTRLANAEKDAWEGSDEPVDVERLADDIEVAARELGVRVTVRRELEPEAPRVPGRVARALVLAAMQAVANAVQHANAAGLAVELRGHAEPGGVVLRVRDTGGGFDVESIPDDRLGIRGSILARVTAVGGRTEIESSTHGTTVTMEWQSGDRW